MMRRFGIFISVLLILAMGVPPALAHHVLGRPSYSLNEDSNTPPSMQLETQIGDYLVTIMAFPAFPKPGQESRIRLYAAHLDDGSPYLGKVRFTIRDDTWFAGPGEVLGEQEPIDGIYRQAMVFSREGDYLVSAFFEANGDPYTIDMPIRIGNPASMLPLALTAGSIGLIMLALALRRRHIRKTRRERIERVARQRSDDG